MIALEVEEENFRKEFIRFQATSKKSIAENLRKQGKLLVVDIAQRTPPFNFAGVKAGASDDRAGALSGSEAKKQGENAIKGDLFGGRDVNVGGFRAKSRGFFIVSDGKMIERDDIVSIFTNKQGKQYGVEKNLYRPNASVQDMITHRDKYRSKATGRMSRAGLRTRDNGRRVFIDRMVVSKAAANRFLKALYGRVGWMAAGWAKAAADLGSNSLPQWIKRHSGAPGVGSLRVSDTDFELIISNKNIYSSLQKAVDRRASAALRDRFWALKKQVDNSLKIGLQEAGFEVGGS